MSCRTRINLLTERTPRLIPLQESSALPKREYYRGLTIIREIYLAKINSPITHIKPKLVVAHARATVQIRKSYLRFV
jgi:hypothetical protein